MKGRVAVPVELRCMSVQAPGVIGESEPDAAVFRR